MRNSFAAVLACLLWPLPALSSNLTVTVMTSGSSEPVADAVVYLDRTDPVTPVHAEIYQQDRAFHPRVLVVPVDSLVDFPNRDNTQHHVYSFSPAKTFNIELYAGKPEAPVRFDQPGIVELGCNIHDQMQAFIVVTDTTAVGQTGANGKVTLSVDATADASTPVTLKVWHPRLPDNTRPVTRTLAGSPPLSLTIDLTPAPVAEDAMDLLQQRFRDL